MDQKPTSRSTGYGAGIFLALVLLVFGPNRTERSPGGASGRRPSSIGWTTGCKESHAPRLEAEPFHSWPIPRDGRGLFV